MFVDTNYKEVINRGHTLTHRRNEKHNKMA